MLKLVGVILILVGIGLILPALLDALGELAAVYNHLAADPLADPQVSEKTAADRMFAHALRGASGIIPLIIGTILVRRRARSARRRPRRLFRR